MKCPLLCIALRKEREIIPSGKLDCLKEECAWWDKTRDQCAIKSACNGIMGIMADTMAIRQQMPRETAFRK